MTPIYNHSREPDGAGRDTPDPQTLTLGSLFDGSGGFPLGGLLSGITPVWASEIEPFPIRVTTKRLPFMKHYGDVSRMDGGKIEPVDIITFGSPCQDMSIAGRREGLDGSRSSLFYEAVRIVKEMRCATDGRYPRYIVWENVPGAFSSNKGADFQSVLEEICSAKGYKIDPARPAKWPAAGEIVADDFSLAWRVFDAQYWGVPQRRKRIYLVADFAGGSAEQILFESESLSGYSPKSLCPWQGTAGSFEVGTGASGFDGYNGSIADKAATLGVNCGMSTGRNGVVLNDQGGNRMDVTEDVTCTLRAEAHHPPCVMEASIPDVVPLENHPMDSRVTLSEDGMVQALTSRMGTGGNNVPLLMKIRSGCEGGGKGPLIQKDKSATLSCNNDQTLFEPKAYGICSKDSNAMKSSNPNSGFYQAGTSRTLDGNGGNPSCNQGGIAVVEPIPFTQNQRDEVRLLGTKSGAICKAATKQQTYVLQGSMIGRKNENGPQGDGINSDVSFTLNTTDRHAVYAMTTGSFPNIGEDTSPTILARDYKDPTAVAFGIDRATMNQGKTAKFNPSVSEELQPTLVAKGPGAVAMGEPEYTVRRLTPTECARLQGFPDWWCDNLGADSPSYGEIDFWSAVFETYRKVMGAASKPKTQAQIVKWLKDPYSDASEYKMWGNGVALPCVCFVLSGIVWAKKEETA